MAFPIMTGICGTLHIVGTHSSFFLLRSDRLMIAGSGESTLFMLSLPQKMVLYVLFGFRFRGFRKLLHGDGDKPFLSLAVGTISSEVLANNKNHDENLLS